MMRVNQEWIGLSGMMMALMLVFLCISVLLVEAMQKEQATAQAVADAYQSIKKQRIHDIQKQQAETQALTDAYETIEIQINNMQEQQAENQALTDAYETIKTQIHNMQEEQAKLKAIAASFQTMQQRLNRDLKSEFQSDLQRWDAQILPDNTIRFKSSDVLFDLNSSAISPNFKNIVAEFFPRYLNILTSNAYQDRIQEIRVEGHTSSIWKSATSREQSYLNNMRLSQDRARSVLQYVYENTTSETKRRWLEKHLRANGMSFSKLITRNDQEDIQASRRVEFRVLTKTDEKIYEIIDTLQKTPLYSIEH